MILNIHVEIVMLNLVFVGVGGLFGSIGRYLLAGATVFRGLEGYGARSLLHTAKILRLSADLPVIIEIVDTDDKIAKFIPLIDHAIQDGLATLEKVNIRFYRSGKSE